MRSGVVGLIASVALAAAIALGGTAPASADLWTYFAFGGVPRPIEAGEVATIAATARAGSAYGQYRLGVLYQLGRGVPRDYAEAARWFRLAAEQGRGDAQYRLGDFYALGRGVPPSLTTAYFWLNLSAARNIPAAAVYRDNISGSLSRAEIAAVQRQSRLWRPVLRMP